MWITPNHSGKLHCIFIHDSHFFFCFSYAPINFHLKKSLKSLKPITVEPAHAPVLVEAVPIPPIADIAPPIIIPTQPLPTDESPLLPIFQSHPIEPLPSYSQSKPKLYRLPRRFRRPIKNENTCHIPVREVIPNAVCPTILPKHICEVKTAAKINKTGTVTPRAHKFMVSYNTFRIAYTFGANSGYTRENAFMEAARCLRYLLARDIQLLDQAMGFNVEIDDICEFVDFGLDYDTGDESASTITTSTIPNTHTQSNQPIFNIINSNVTIANEPSRHVVYDYDDNLEFIFEEPNATVDDDMPELDFDDIIEI